MRNSLQACRLQRRANTCEPHTLAQRNCNVVAMAGLHNGTAEYAQKMIKKGFNLVTVGSDSRYITEGAKADLEKLKGIKETKSKGY